MVYADYNSSSPLTSQVGAYLQKRLSGGGPYANPNSLHHAGRQIMKKIEESRHICAEILGAKPEQILFNSGSSEGITSAFHSCCEYGRKNRKKHILISSIEHHAVIRTADYYSSKGFVITQIPADSNGVTDAEYIKSFLRRKSKGVSLVSVMAANNETGVVQPYEKISAFCRENDVLYFCDTAQLIGKLPFNFEESGFDFAVVSGHKIGALPGCGILLIKNPLLFTPLILGTIQEKGLRGGTQNYIGIETLAIALEDMKHSISHIDLLRASREKFEKNLKEKFPCLYIAGEIKERLPGTTLVSYPGIYGQAVQIELESRGIFVTTSSACLDNDPEPSHVLQAMNVPDHIARGAVRISLGGDDKGKDTYSRIFSGLCRAYERLTAIGSF
ncbi:MAG: cysteine desulfurase [Candidatus Aureabacteria bacterium]|nr:cysteine desulfurase [Candidatus Auribacterota bacterium]